jgi:hypothetical protein
MRRAQQRRSDRTSDPIQAAIALLIQNQAAFVAQQAETNKIMAESERRLTRDVEEIKATIARMSEDITRLYDLIEQLPETLRQKIGFRTPLTL